MIRWKVKVYSSLILLGTLSYVNGDRFEGTWENNVIVGKGKDRV